MDSLAFLDKPPRTRPQPVYVLHGDEPFLKRHVQAVLRTLVLGEDGDLGLSSFPGDRTAFSVVHNELTTLPFVGSRRLVIVESADPFVTAERAKLEKYVQQPSTVGVLVLDVNSWPANTKLAKLVPEPATLVCKSLPSARLPEWCVRWAEAGHSKQLAVPAARLLVDLVGADMGLLDQELAKLAAAVGEAGRIDARDVDRLVNNSRDENTFAIFDLIAAGESGKALAHLDRLITQGEDPNKLLGMFSYQLRLLAQVARLHAHGLSLDSAMKEAHADRFKRQVEQQLRHLGRRRLDRLFDWLLEVDLGVKGGSSLPARTLLERLVVRLSRPAG